VSERVIVIQHQVSNFSVISWEEQVKLHFDEIIIWWLPL